MNKKVITIFGATGDLTLRKLLPALATLIKKGATNLTIIAVGRRNFTSEEYLQFVSESGVFNGKIDVLRPNLVYVTVDVMDEESYSPLLTLIEAYRLVNPLLESIYYLAVGPDLFTPIALNLAKLNLVKKGDTNAIIAFEKPFGHIHEEASEINKVLNEKFSKEQIYHVDHYLGKEMMQKIIGLRFANDLIEGTWNKDYLKEIKIVVSEKDGILNRGAYYDESGVLNDMVQSHLLQIVALLAMERPASLTSKDISASKVKVLSEVEYVSSSSLLGQYIGYQQEKGVSPNSPISTLAFLTMKVNNERFNGVPFYLYTGKKLAKQEAYIEIIYEDKGAKHLFNNPRPNRIKIEIAPEARIVFELNTYSSENGGDLELLRLEYCYSCNFPSPVKEAYEILFSEMFEKRQNLFPSFEEIEASWQIIRQISRDKPRAIKYEPGFSLEGVSNE